MTQADEWRRRKAHEALDRLLDKVGSEVAFGRLELTFVVEDAQVSRYEYRVLVQQRLQGPPA